MDSKVTDSKVMDSQVLDNQVLGNLLMVVEDGAKDGDRCLLMCDTKINLLTNH
jgi:hypothetical protein